MNSVQLLLNHLVYTLCLKINYWDVFQQSLNSVAAFQLLNVLKSCTKLENGIITSVKMEVLWIQLAFQIRAKGASDQSESHIAVRFISKSNIYIFCYMYVLNRFLSDLVHYLRSYRRKTINSGSRCLCYQRIFLLVYVCAITAISVCLLLVLLLPYF